MEQLKTCSKCKQELPISYFDTRALALGYLYSLCKICANVANRKWAATRKKKDAYNREILADSYVSSLLNAQLPQPLIEAKRAHLQLVRILKEDKQKCKSK